MAREVSLPPGNPIARSQRMRTESGATADIDNPARTQMPRQGGDVSLALGMERRLGRSFSPKLLMVVVLIERAVGEEECVHGSMIQEKDRFACQEYYVDRYKAALPEATAAGSCSQPR